MSKIFSYILPGLVIAIILGLVSAFLVPEAIQMADWFNILLAILQILCIVVPGVICFLTNPPGRGAQP